MRSPRRIARSARGVAQLGSASALGAEGRRFKSCHPDFEFSRRIGPPAVISPARACYTPRTLAAHGIGVRLVSLLLALAPGAPLAIAATRSGAMPTPRATLAALASPEPPHAAVAEAVPQLQDSVAQLTARIDQLANGSTPPPWAAEMRADLGQRVERVMEIQERLAARIETPLPRLDEPIILFTVAASTAVLGFVIGRGVQRRRERRDGRFRL